MVRKFWCEIHRQAFSEAVKALGLESKARVVVGAVTIVGALGCLFFWGSADASRDELIVRIAIAASLVAVFPFVYVWKLFVLPAHRDAQHKRNASRSPLVLSITVRPKEGLHVEGEWFSIGVRNDSDVTLYDVTVRALDSWFTREILATARGVETYRQPLAIIELAALHPGVTEAREVFGLSYGREASHPDYILNGVRQFTVEASARDVPTERQEAEYNPDARPMLRLLTPG